MILFAPEAVEDLERIFDFHAATSTAWAAEQLAVIERAVAVLDEHPLVGRLARGERSLRELIISVGKSGYVALYEFDEVDWLVRVVGVRHQREAGFRGR